MIHRWLLLAAVAVSSIFGVADQAQGLPCTTQLEQEMEACYFEYSWWWRQFCYAEAYARYLGCIADAAGGN